MSSDLPVFFQGTEMPTAAWWEALWPDPAGVLAAVGLRSGMDVIGLCSGDGWFTLQVCQNRASRRHQIALPKSPLDARAQQGERVRRIGVLTGGPNDTSFRSDLSAFQKRLKHLGWIEGRNVEFNVRSGDNNAQCIVTEAKELVRFRKSYVPPALLSSADQVIE
jgi:hypothetical protein